MAVFMVMAGFIMADMFARIQRYVIDHPEGLPPPVPGQAPSLPLELIPDLSWMQMPSLVLNVLVTLLLAAAVVRRLHDRDRTGLWGLMPLPFTLVSMANPKAATALATGSHEPSSLDRLMLLSSALFWIALIALIVLLAGEGTKGPNRFGQERAPSP